MSASENDPDRDRDRERRRRLAAVFGEVLPEQTTDDRPESPESAAGSERDAWLRGEVPPHHG